eukprot:TRINITY_DN1324_c0_g1_i2.p1 TRINITY_DN1324_c0_g1~~TRINITY_DN1324_c0_g1_i2.p1  ORF type:complete len:121 (+),score=28.33 TRINITY_DN1324_c0_g1_i2:322-684(+)
MRERVCGSDSVEVADSLLSLAGAENPNVTYDVPITQRMRALKIYETQLGRNHWKTAQALHWVAWLIFMKGGNKKGNEELKQYITRASALTRTLYGLDHPKTQKVLQDAISFGYPYSKEEK